MYKPTVSTRLPYSAREALERAAKAAGTTRAGYARVLLVRALRDEGYTIEDEQSE